jgi:hypothetical protein
MTTKSTPATIRMIVVPSMTIPSSKKSRFTPSRERNRVYSPHSELFPVHLNSQTGHQHAQSLLHSAITKAPSELIHPRAAALNQNAQHDYEKQPGNDPNDNRAFHISAFNQFPKNVLNDSDIKITAGPRVTRNSAGKIKNTSGNTSLTEVLAAISSIC